jgi:flagellar hook assembly protein FlgD
VAVDFARLYGNPMTAGSAVFSFGLAKDDNVEIKVYDVGGRLIKTLADQRFKAGEHRLTWDGLANDGRRVARGVYFARVRYKSSLFNAANKIIVLK